jgi:transaldolase
MKFFIDSADTAAIIELAKTGLVDGVTTNPSLLAQQKGSVQEVIEVLSTQVNGPISLEVTEKEPQKVLEQARKIAALHKNVVVKIPFDPIYLSVIKQLVSEKIALNITLIFSALHALSVAKLGVAYLSPFVGRIDDLDRDGLELLEEIVTIKHQYNFSFEVIAASLRTLTHVKAAALMGIDIATISPELFKKMLHNQLALDGMKKFDEDWKKSNLKSL